MSTLVRQRALQTWILSIWIIPFYFLFFYIETVHSFLPKIRLVLLFGSICQHFTFFANSYLFYLVLLLKITQFNTVLCDGKISRDCDKEVTSRKSWSWWNLWAEAGPNRASIDSSEKRIMLDYQLTVLLVKVVCTTFSENSEPVWNVHVSVARYTWRPLACYPFINIKLAAYHLLLYVVYLCQKS